MTNVSRSGTQGRIDSFFTKKPASQKVFLIDLIFDVHTYFIRKIWSSKTIEHLKRLRKSRYPLPVLYMNK